MANTVIALKKSAIPSATPASLANGELAINYADGKIFYKAANGAIVSFAQGGPSFGTVNANGTLVVAATSGDVLTLVPGNNISISADAITDKITISASGGSIAPAFDQANAAYNKANSTTYTSNVVISTADNTNAALRITQTGTGNALVVEDSTNPDSTPFVVDANGSVGIGTSSPVSKLTVQGVINANDGSVAGGTFALGTSINGVLSATSASLLTINGAGYGAVSINGNVGIGTSSPSQKLHVNGTARIANAFFNTDSIEINTYGTGNRYAYIDFVGDDTYTDYALRVMRNNTGANASSVMYHRGIGDLAFITQDAANISFWTSSAVKATLTTAGNLGIGTTSPETKLHTVGGNSRIENSTVPYLDLKHSSAGTDLKFGRIGWNSGQFSIETVNDAYTTPTNRFTIDSSGKAKLWATADVTPDANWNGQLTVNGNAYSGGFSFDATGMWVGHNSSSRALILSTDEKERMRVSGLGLVGISTTAPTANLHVSGNVIVSAATSTDAFRITQTGAGNALVVEDSTNPDSTPFVVASDGKVGIGLTSPSSEFHLRGSMTVEANTTVNHSFYSAGTGVYPNINLYAAAGNIITPTQVANSSYLGFLNFGGYDGLSYQQTASIYGLAGTTSLGSIPTSLIFDTGGTERMRIDASGNVGIGTASVGAYKLNIFNSTNTATLTQSTSGYALNRINSGSYTHDTIVYSASASAYSTFNGASYTIGTSSASGSVYLQTNNTTRITINEAGTTTFSGVAYLNGGYRVPVQPAHYIGTANTQQILNNYGWSNGVGRWKPVLESNASLAYYSYDAAGGSATARLTINNTTGAVVINNTLSVNGTTTSQIQAGSNAGTATGLLGQSNTSQGVYGTSFAAAAVYGYNYGNAEGVYGYSAGTGFGARGHSVGTYGVYGQTGSNSYGGVIGYNNGGTKYGILGYSTTYCFYGSGDAYIGGTLSKNAGSFKIDHPLPSMANTHYLVHSFVESPTADNIYRGKIKLNSGSATVNLDDAANMTEGTFTALNGNIQVFLQNDTGWSPVRGSIIMNLLNIECQDETSNDTISWLVIGTRQDAAIMESTMTDEFGQVVIEKLKTLDPPPPPPDGPASTEPPTPSLNEEPTS